MRASCLAAGLWLALLGSAVAGAKLESLDVVTATGPHHFTVEIADDDASRERGLMKRESLPADRGMLFEFPARSLVTFWMKDTLLPLDMVFIDEDGTVRRIVENAKPLSEELIPSVAPVTGVLELNAGQAAAIRLQPGDKVKAAFFNH